MKKVYVYVLSMVFFLGLIYTSIDMLIVKEKTLFKKNILSRKAEKNFNYDEPEKFLEFYNLIRTKQNEKFPGYGANYKIKELLKAKNIASTRSLNKTNGYKKLPWVERGPGNVSGRVRAIEIAPDDTTNKTWYIGTASGGVWKTDDAGETWENLTLDLPNLATNTLAVSKNNPDVIYAGTGEGYGNFGFVQGQGIWKSSDKGKTWEQLNIDIIDNDEAFNTMRMVIDPNDENTLVVAIVSTYNTNTKYFMKRVSKILKTTDGGKSWKKVFEYTLDTQTSPEAKTIQQIIANPQNFNTLYATVRSKGILKSTDAGETWEEIFPKIFKGTNRLEVAISSTDTSKLYISAEGDFMAKEYDKLFMTDDAGKTWKKGKAKEKQRVIFVLRQGFYDNTIAVHPYDSDVFFVGGTDIYKIKVTDKSDTSFTYVPYIVTDGYEYFGGKTKGVHVDHHALVMIPIDTTLKTFGIINGNDGGVAFSSDSGDTFIQTGDTFLDSLKTYKTVTGLNISQFYGVDKMNGANRYVGGTQDNGSWFSEEDPYDNSKWISAPSGDGFEAAWHYKDANKIIESTQGVLIGTSDGGKTWNVLKTKGSGMFFSKVENSKQDPDLVFSISPEGIERSNDFGSTWLLVKPNGFSINNAIHATVKISLASPKVVWAAAEVTDNNPIQISRDGGLTFTKTSPIKLELGNITGFATHPLNEATAYALFSFANTPKLFRTTDYGKTWEELSGFGQNKQSSNGFPDVAVFSLLVMPFDTNIIWVGTEIGIFESVDNGATWHYADNGFPAVSTFQMKVINNQIVVATHGRGIWSVDIPQLKDYEPIDVTLGPRVTEFYENNGTVETTINFRSKYDSTIVYIQNLNNKNITVLGKIAGNKTVKDTTVSYHINITKTEEVRLFIESYLNNEIYREGGQEFIIYKLNKVVAEYENDFSAVGENEFYMNGMEIKEDSELGAALNTLHPYSEKSIYTAQLLTPIKIAKNSVLEYDDIALVEPGLNSAKNIDDLNFFDYVVVEGTNNYGKTWKYLDKGYDARYNKTWLQYYLKGKTPTANLFVHHKIELTKSFSEDDEILIRFRLFSDELETAWGWIVDNISIKTNSVGVDSQNEIPRKYALKQNYPNPFNPETTIQYSIPSLETLHATSQHVRLNVYNILGKKVATLVNKKQKPGNYKVTFDASFFASGTYFYRLTAGNYSETKKMVLLK